MPTQQQQYPQQIPQNYQQPPYTAPPYYPQNNIYPSGLYQQPPSNAKPPLYKKWWLWVIIVLVLLLGIGACSAITSDNTSSRSNKNSNNNTEQVANAVIVDKTSSTATVPDFIGMNLEDAEKTLDGLGLKAQHEAADGKNIVMRKNWTVKTQDPAAGTSVATGATVKLVAEKTSGTSDEDPTPVALSTAYNGNTSPGTVLKKRNKGIVVTEKYSDGSESIIKDFKIDVPVTLVAGQLAQVVITADGLSCTLDVFCPAPVEAIVPDVIGHPLDEAETILSNAGFKFAHSSDTGSTIIMRSNWNVTAQDPAPGTMLVQNEQVRLMATKTVDIDISDTRDPSSINYEVVDYDSLARTPDVWKNKDITVKGQVLQVIEASGLLFDTENIYLVEITPDEYGYWNDIVYVRIPQSSLGSSRILEDDIVTVYGRSDGLYTYISVIDTGETVPEIYADKIERVE